ncbi:hypothetical protein ACFC09_32945 [Streptomyces sp. NPDC056161]|uniref:hypothetical protein n=1 Tax=Streptomyces sp. NPDC056161 TaxID=3345732 RepID=UPI0035DC9B61
MLADRVRSVDAVALAVEIEGLLDAPEPGHELWGRPECALGGSYGSALLISPPTPRPKKP